MMKKLNFLNDIEIKKIDNSTYSTKKNDNSSLFDITHDEILKFQKNMKNKNWKEVAYDMFFETYPWLYKIITDSNRSDFLFLLDLKKDYQALDIGAGWGQISIPLSRFCNVVSLESDLTKINIIKEIAHQENRHNIQYVVSGLHDHIFENEQFDLIILNGVLGFEDTPLDVNDSIKTQQMFLKKIFNLLKPNGELYIGTENKYGLKYLLGEKDDHSGLEDFTYLDDTSKNLFYSSVIGKPLTYSIYDKKTYEKMLKDSGFENIQFFGNLPDFKLPRLMVNLANNSNIKFTQENLEFIPEFDGATGRVSQLNHKLRSLYPIFPPETLSIIFPSYSIIARKLK